MTKTGKGLLFSVGVLLFICTVIFVGVPDIRAGTLDTLSKTWQTTINLF